MALIATWGRFKQSEDASGGIINGCNPGMTAAPPQTVLGTRGRGQLGNVWGQWPASASPGDLGPVMVPLGACFPTLKEKRERGELWS